MATEEQKPASHSPVGSFAKLCDASAVHPDVFEFLSGYPRATARQQTDVLLIDQFRRWNSNNGLAAEHYFGRCKGVAAESALRMEVLVKEFGYRKQQGEHPRARDFTARFPDLTQLLIEALPEDEPAAELPVDPLPAAGLSDGLSSDSTVVYLHHLLSRCDQPLELPQDTSVSDTTIMHITPLAQFAPFSTLPENVIRMIEAQMHEKRFSSGEYLMRQGNPGTSLMLLCEGTVQITTVDDAGQQRLIARDDRIQVLGEMALLTSEPRSANVIATSPVRALVLPAAQFHKLAQQFPDISLVLSHLISRRLGSPGRSDVLAGKVLGGYRIKRRLGRGGMAVVYEAVELAGGRQIALKMLSHRLIYDKSALEQFQREADVIESFEHGNIVRMYGRFQAFHTYFIVMQFCDGVTLDEVVSTTGAVPEDEVWKILGQVASALEYAHARDIVHRDVKPSNIIVNRDGSVLLMDFGLAVPVTDASAVTSGSLVGTPRYMAPEQMSGESAGKKADYFSFGCVAYELLTGEPLLPETDLLTLLSRHTNWQSPDFRQTRPGLSEKVYEMLDGCLQKHPEHRRLDLKRIALLAEPVSESLRNIASPEDR